MMTTNLGDHQPRNSCNKTELKCCSRTDECWNNEQLLLSAIIITVLYLVLLLLLLSVCTVGLMQENLRLGEEVRTMKKLMDHERQEFQSEIRRMESNTDELQAQLERTIEEHRVTVEDYRQKIDALEKQLKSDKQFIEVG